MRMAGVARQAGSAQGWSLIATAWVSTVAVVGIAPVLPQIAAAFADTPGLQVKISLIATLPALGCALLSWPYGVLADRVGGRGILLRAVLAYGLLGMAPMVLSTLDEIVAARTLVGIAEAAIMTCGTALLVDLFHGSARAKWLALQAGVAPIIATAFLFLAGALGQHGWRLPFSAYGIALLLLPPLLIFTWESQRGSNTALDIDAGHAPKGSFSWRRQFLAAGITVFAMIGFMLTIVQVPFVLTQRGIADPGEIGLLAALLSMANPVGSLLFGIARWRTPTLFAVAFTLVAAGCAIITLVPGTAGVVAGALIANLGNGFVLPTCITWTLQPVPHDKRGVASGLMQSSVFLGQFASPLVLLALAGLAGSLGHAIFVYALAALAAAAFAGVAMSRPVLRPQSAGP